MAPSASALSKPALRKVSFDTHLQRPTLRKKVTSPTGPSLLGGLRESSHEVIEPPKPDMAASFLQFCAMCEKQIMTPCNSILYCSEACRRKDGCKPLSAATLTELTPPSSAPSSPSKPILLSRTPTGSYFDLPPSARIPPELHDHRPDLDPTEWKPKSRGQRTKQSEAFRYLSSFHRSTMSMSDSVDHMSTQTSSSVSVASGQASTEVFTVAASMPVPVPGLWRSSLSGTTATTISTPSSSSYNNTANEYGHTHTSGYDFSTRPLPIRHNRWYSVSGATPKGVDLVTPHVAPPVVVRVASSDPDAGSQEDLWGKKIVIRNTPSQGGMGALFGKP